jgi:regulatory protein
MNYALFLLGRRDYSSKELLDKLSFKFDKGEAQVVIEELSRRGLISDEQYMVKIIEKYAFTKRYGFLKVEEELFKRGIKREVYSKALAELYPFEKELNNAKYFLNKKPPEKIRLYLLSRGFRLRTVQKILADFNRKESDNEE